MENEANWLKILNKHNVGPEFLFAGKNYIVYRFVKGDFILEALLGLTKNRIKGVIKNIFEQCFTLDNLKVAKEEMSHPPKHVVITKSLKPVLIDFERAHKTANPHNVTQFCQFIISGHPYGLLKKKGFALNKNAVIRLAKLYKSESCKVNFQLLLDEVLR